MLFDYNITVYGLKTLNQKLNDRLLLNDKILPFHVQLTKQIMKLSNK